MTTKKKSLPKMSTYERLVKMTGETITFATYLEAIAETDFGSRAACARKLGMAPQTLNSYIKAKRIPGPALAAKIAKKLGYDPLVFMELALSDSVRKTGYGYKVELTAA